MKQSKEDQIKISLFAIEYLNLYDTLDKNQYEIIKSLIKSSIFVSRTSVKTIPQIEEPTLELLKKDYYSEAEEIRSTILENLSRFKHILNIEDLYK